MISTPIGTRVGAVQRITKGVAYFYGWGRYIGRDVPRDAVGWIAEMAVQLGHDNPMIALDSGETVFGCECWWGEEDEVRVMLKGHTIEMVSINEVRAAHRAKTNAEER